MSPETRRLSIALAISLLANMFFIGFNVAHVAERSPSPNDGGQPGTDELNPRATANTRPPEGRQAPTPTPADRSLRRLLRPNRKAMRAEREEIRAARRAVSEALVADPFDVQALDAALTSLRVATGHAQLALHRVLLEAAPTMTAEQRQQLSRAHRLWSGPPGRRPPRHPGERRHAPR